MKYFEGMNKISDEIFFTWIKTIWNKMGESELENCDQYMTDALD